MNSSSFCLITPNACLVFVVVVVVLYVRIVSQSKTLVAGIISMQQQQKQKKTNRTCLGRSKTYKNNVLFRDEPQHMQPRRQQRNNNTQGNLWFVF